MLHHLANHIGDPDSTILFAGFQAENTLGRRIIDGASPIRVYGEEYAVRARIVRVEGYSAHADRAELLSWATRARDRGRIRRVFVVHGEAAAQTAFAQALRDEVGIPQVTVPVRGERVSL